MTESGYSRYSDQVSLEMGLKKVKVGNDQEMAQSEIPTPKTRLEKLNLQPGPSCSKHR